MNVPRRYRVALAAYPARYRSERGQELLTTLADGDDDRGRPSTREAVALAYRGAQQRGRIALSGDGLLAIAAVLVLFTAFAGLTWAERLFLYRGEVAAIGTDGPGTWSGVALMIGAFTVLAAGPFDAVDDPRRRRIAAAAALLAVILLTISPGSAFKYSIPNFAELVEIFRWKFAAIYANRWDYTVPVAVPTAAGTWLGLRGLALVRPAARRRVLAAGLFTAGAVAVTLTWNRPDLVVPYGRDAFSDLGAAAFVTAASTLLALTATIRASEKDSPALPVHTN